MSWTRGSYGGLLLLGALAPTATVTLAQGVLKCHAAWTLTQMAMWSAGSMPCRMTGYVLIPDNAVFFVEITSQTAQFSLLKSLCQQKRLPRCGGLGFWSHHLRDFVKKVSCDSQMKPI
jgi:hypothetical protein